MSTDTFPALTPPGQSAEAVEPSQRERLRLRLAVLRPRLAGLELTRWHVLVALTILVAISVWLRTRGIRLHYWVDEGLSVGIASHPLTRIPSLLGQDGSPPLYYLLLHVWMAVRGRGEVATHELSLIFALLTIPVAYWAGSSLFGRRVGLTCALLAAGVPYLSTSAQETRMYALLALLALIASGAFVETFVRRDRRYLPVFVVATAAALYAHNWALFLALMAGVAFLFCVRESPPAERRGLWRDGGLAFGGVAVLYAPWLPTLLYQARHTGAPWDLPPVVWSLSQGLYSTVGGRGAAVALLLAGGAGLWALRQPGNGRERLLLAAKALIILGFGTLVVAWAYSKVTPAWAIRYLGVIVGPLLLLFGLGVARAGRLGIIALVLVASWWVLDPVPTKLNSKSNVASVAAKVRAHLGSDALVLSTQPEQVPTLAYYLPSVKHFGTTLGPVPDPRVVDWRGALRRLHRSSVPSVLMPMVDRLAPGQRLLLVRPIALPKTPQYLQLINQDSSDWQTALEHDPALRKLASTDAGSAGSGLGVEAILFIKR
jgi:hypothetical protein